jgi:secretion/DNA translocation related TadE-like protein
MTGQTAVTGARRIGRRSLDDRGSAAVVMLGVIAAVLALTVSGLLLASAVLASHRARAAADLAALAAAGVLMRGGPAGSACESAAQAAAANYGRLQQCIASGREVRLTVAVHAGPRGVGIATARSRAGPGPNAG